MSHNMLSKRQEAASVSLTASSLVGLTGFEPSRNALNPLKSMHLKISCDFSCDFRTFLPHTPRLVYVLYHLDSLPFPGVLYKGGCD